MTPTPRDRLREAAEAIDAEVRSAKSVCGESLHAHLRWNAVKALRVALAEEPKVERVEIGDFSRTDSRATLEVSFWEPKGVYPKTALRVVYHNGGVESNPLRLEGTNWCFYAERPIHAKSKAEEPISYERWLDFVADEFDSQGRGISAKRTREAAAELRRRKE